MIISRNPLVGPSTQLSLREDNIEFVAEAKCLRVTIDRGLNWNTQAKKVVKDPNV